MTFRQCREAAQDDANGAGVELVIVYDPISNAEERGLFGYCPARAVPLLFPFGRIIQTIRPKSAAVQPTAEEGS